MKISVTFFEKCLPYLFGFISGFCVFYFLYFFRAYGIQEGHSYSGHSFLFRCLSFGILTCTYLTTLERWLKPKWNINTLARKLFWYIFLIFIGCQLIFVLFNFFWNWQEWNLKAYGLILKEFPLMMALALILYFAIASLVKQSVGSEKFLVFSSENGKDVLKIKIADFLYAEAMENYVAIIFESKGKTRKHLIRKPLKTLAEDLRVYSNINRIHRSYLVNTDQITSVKQARGNVYINLGDTELKVSKSHQKNFLTGSFIRP